MEELEVDARGDAGVLQELAYIRALGHGGDHGLGHLVGRVGAQAHAAAGLAGAPFEFEPDALLVGPGLRVGPVVQGLAGDEFAAAADAVAQAVVQMHQPFVVGNLVDLGDAGAMQAAAGRGPGRHRAAGQHGVGGMVGGGFAGVVRRRCGIGLGLRRFAAQLLLNGVRQFMRQQPQAAAGVRRIAAGAEDKVLAAGIGAGVQRPRRGRGGGIGMHADLREVVAEAAFHQAAGGAVEGRARRGQNRVDTPRGGARQGGIAGCSTLGPALQGLAAAVLAFAVLGGARTAGAGALDAPRLGGRRAGR